MSLSVIVLAAGKGSRMRSDLPKVLHPLAGKAMLAHVIDTARSLKPHQIIVVVGHGASLVEQSMAGEDLEFVLQEEQLGTGHAVAQAMSQVTGDSVLVIYGDVPLTRTQTLASLIEIRNDKPLAILSVELSDPKGYGRIVRDATDNVCAIIEEKDADDEIRKIREGNTGILCADKTRLENWLGQLKNNNTQGEYYLTDCIAACVNDGDPVLAKITSDEIEVTGVNDKLQLHLLEREYQYSVAAQLLEEGVTLADADRVDVRGELRCGRDVSIDINCVFIGDVQLGDGVSIGPNCVIENSRIGPGSTVFANCVFEGADIEGQSNIGPFARLRPGAVLKSGARAGNFVEIKKSVIGAGSKVNHLSYVGDAQLGKNVNVGAGTITCNYDGVNKHQTRIGDDAFIGSNSALVAPVNIGAGATIGAGSTISTDAPDHQLTLERSKQKTYPAWKRPEKKPKG